MTRAVLGCATVLAMTGGGASVVLNAGAGAANGSDAVRRFLSSGPPTVRSYEARRSLQATAQNGGMRASLEALVRFEGGRFSYEIVGGDGSSILRSYVLERALAEEERTINEGRTGEAAISAANYRFTLAGVDPNGLAQVGIVPHAPAPMLIDGRITVEPSGALVAIEGRLSREPSFWTRRVDIERRYATIGGARVPVLMRSHAQVRVVGTGTFEMRYTYLRVNGRRVDGAPGGGGIVPNEVGPHIIPANDVRRGTSQRTLS